MFMKDLLETLEAQARIGITHDQKAARVLLAAPEMLVLLKEFILDWHCFRENNIERAINLVAEIEGKE